MLLLSFAGLAIGLAISAALVSLGARLFLADKLEAKKSAARVSTIKDAVLGRARATDDWAPDGRVKGGMVYNREKKRLEVSGRLSNDTIDRVFR
jgi:hypothetical protein